MNEKEKNLYDSLMNLARSAAENLKELDTWKELSLERAKEINTLHERHIEEEDRSYKIVLYWFRKYSDALKGSLNETNAIKKCAFSLHADEYLNKYIGAQQIYEAIFGLFRFRPDDYTNIFGKDENTHED